MYNPYKNLTKFKKTSETSGLVVDYRNLIIGVAERNGGDYYLEPILSRTEPLPPELLMSAGILLFNLGDSIEPQIYKSCPTCKAPVEYSARTMKPKGFGMIASPWIGFNSEIKPDANSLIFICYEDNSIIQIKTGDNLKLNDYIYLNGSLATHWRYCDLPC